jgi:hypothetical protein
MARSTPNQYPVHLTAEQRERFEDICSNGRAPATKICHARLLLLSDRGRRGGGLWEIRCQFISFLRYSGRQDGY